jgi:hypothetical protein
MFIFELMAIGTSFFSAWVAVAVKFIEIYHPSLPKGLN